MNDDSSLFTFEKLMDFGTAFSYSATPGHKFDEARPKALATSSISRDRIRATSQRVLPRFLQRSEFGYE